MSARKYHRNPLSRLLRLENRIAPALSIGFSRVTGLLSVTSDGSDAVVLGANSDGQVLLNGGTLMANGEPVPATAITGIDVIGGPGPNTIDASKVNRLYFPELTLNETKEKRISLLGGDGNDTITGSPIGDYIDGGTGKNTVDGGRGDDLIGWNFVSGSSVNGGAGDDQGFLSLDGLAPTVPAIQAAVTPTGTVTFFVDGVSQTANSLEFVEIDGSNFGSAAGSTTITIVMGTTAAATCNIKLKEASKASLGHIDASSKPKEIVVVGSKDSSSQATVLTFEFDAEYHLVGGAGNDEFTVTPGPHKINIDGAGGNDSLEVNHLGYAVTQTTGMVQVAGRAAVSHVNIESVQTSRTVFGDAAEVELRAAGVTSSAVWVTTGFFEVLTVTVKNQSAIPLNNVVMTLGGFVEAAFGSYYFNPKEITIDKPVPWQKREILRTRATSGLTVNVDPNPQGTPIADILAGEFAYDPRMTISATSIPAGGQATATIEMPHSPHSGNYHLTDAWPTKMGWGASNYQYSFSGSYSVSDSMDGPTTAVSVTPSGKTSATAGSSLAGVSADGAVVLQLSSATDYDSYVTSVFPGAHVFANNVMVDTTPAGTASGNGSSSQPVISADGRFVAFTTNATNLSTAVVDTNGVSDVAVRDLFTGKLTIISKTSAGLTGNGRSYAPQFSADGRFVYFLSEATNLVGGVSDANAGADLFRFDTSTNLLACVSVTPAGTATGNFGVDLTSATGAYSISADGDVATWFTQATDLVVGGSPTGMHVIHKKGADHPDFAWWPTSSPTMGLRITADGSRVVFWTEANLSTQTGIPDTNGVSDLFSWEPGTGSIQALSINNLKTNMGNGPTPGSAFDAVALSSDGSTIVFTSDANNLIPGPAVTTSDGLFRMSGLGGSMSMPTIERIDTTITGFGGNNHTPTISPDGNTVAWTSLTNYGSTPATYTANQAWVLVTHEATHVVQNVSGGFGLNPSFGARPPLLANSGHLVLFESQSPLAGVDGNSFFDVFASVGHESLVYYAPMGNGADSVGVSMTKVGGTPAVQLYNFASSTPFATRPLAATRWLFLNGADNEVDNLTIDYGSGLAGLANILFDGGDGLGLDSANTSGASKPRVHFTFATVFTNSVGFDVSELTLTGVEQLHNKLFVGGLTCVTTGAQTTTVDAVSGTGETRVSSSAGGMQFDVFFDDASELTMIFQPGSTPGNASITLNGLGPSADPLPVLMVIADQRDFNIDASKMTRSVSIFGGSGNDTVTGGSGNDLINGGVGNDQLNGGPGDDTYAVGSFFDLYYGDLNTDSGGRDTLDFSDAPYGIKINTNLTAPQMLTPLGHTLTLSGKFENVIGGEFDDQVLVAFISGDTGSVDGGRSVSGGVGDKLTFDCSGQPTGIVGSKRAYVSGHFALDLDGFESVQLTNNAAAPQVAALIINDDAVQRSMVTSIQVSFNGPVSFVGPPADAFQLSGPGGLVSVTATPQTSFGTTSVLLTFTGSVNVGGSLIDGQYTLKVLSAKIVGGLVGGDFTSAPGTIHRLYGDADGNHLVDGIDYGAFRAAFNTNSKIFDFDGSGVVDGADYGQFRQRFGVMI